MRLLSRTLSAAALALGVALSGASLTPAQAAPHHRYVALGDSYSSGVGARDYLADGTTCLRSLGSYAGVLAERYGLQLDLQACSGAVTADVLKHQVGALGPETDLVTISVGGNDIGFSAVMAECAQPDGRGDCDGAIDRALQSAEQQLPSRLDAVYRAIRDRAPHARVVVVGYPRLFNGCDCHEGTYFSRSEMIRLNAASDRLNHIIARAAGRAGFRFADVRLPFLRHAVCDRDPWIHNVVSTLPAESFHPNARGYQRGYAPTVALALGLWRPFAVTGTASAELASAPAGSVEG